LVDACHARSLGDLYADAVRSGAAGVAPLVPETGEERPGGNLCPHPAPACCIIDGKRRGSCRRGSGCAWVAISSGQDFGYSGKNGKVRPVSEEAVEQPALTRQLPELQGSAMTQSEYPPDAPSRIWHDRISKYLPDLIFGANDGIITTLAVVSG